MPSFYLMPVIYKYKKMIVNRLVSGILLMGIFIVFDSVHTFHLETFTVLRQPFTGGILYERPSHDKEKSADHPNHPIYYDYFL
jgi:hypothetical protein